MSKRRSWGTAALAVLSSLPAGGALGCEGLVAGPAGIVMSVSDGDTLVLDSGLVVRLIGIQAPKLPLGRDGFVAWPLGTESRSALETMVMGQRVRVRYGGERRDRHDRVLGQLFVEGGSDDGLWVQQAMLAQGMARVYSFPDNRRCIDELMQAETRARAGQLGIWSDPYYSVRRADRPTQLEARAGHYELVEGRIVKADRAAGRVYLNFGRSYEEDFTAVIDGSALRRFDESGLDPLRLDGALVRVRGWIDLYDGPRIDVTHPEQIEVLAQR